MLRTAPARKIQALALLLLAAGCVAPSSGPVAPSPIETPPLNVAGLEAVMGADARSLVQRLGSADLDVREGSGRKLQFSSKICVLDTYLYPSRSGGEQVVAWVDARTPDGRDFDRASCVAALIAQSQSR